MLLPIKVVPGASRDRVAGPLGDRLKVCVSAQPEKGRANRAVIDVLARHFGVSVTLIRVVKGQASHLKTVAIDAPGDLPVREQLGDWFMVGEHE